MVQFIDESDVDWSGKIAKTRRFSGQTYRLSGVWYFKKNANEEARDFESRGDQFRDAAAERTSRMSMTRGPRRRPRCATSPSPGSPGMRGLKK